VSRVHADARLIAAAPDLLTELESTAAWLDERAKLLLQLAMAVARNSSPYTTLKTEAARFNGRAALVRQAILKATT
jgi:hypothetical protein